MFVSTTCNLFVKRGLNYGLRCTDPLYFSHSKPPNVKQFARFIHWDSQIKHILKNGKQGDSVSISGWVRTTRTQKNVGFLELNDGSQLKSLQVVGDPKVFEGIHQGSSVVVEGKLVESPGSGQSLEVQPQKITLLGSNAPDNPLQPKYHTMEFLRDIAHLRARTNTFSAVMRVRNEVSRAVSSFFHERGFLLVHTPIITTNDCEGAGEAFEVSAPFKQGESIEIKSKEKNTEEKNKTTTILSPSTPKSSKNPPSNEDNTTTPNKYFFNKPSYLTVSGQLEAEIYACSMSRVYTFGPTFRAEHSQTHRHLAEFWMIEPEMAFVDLNQNMDVAEEFIQYLVRHVLENSIQDMEFFNSKIDPNALNRAQQTLKGPFHRISYSDAITLLEKSGENFTYPVKWGVDLHREHEKYIVDKFDQKPVFVYNYPTSIKPFYMRKNDFDNGVTVAAMDLLVPEVGELIGGSQREERYEQLKEAMQAKGLCNEDYMWYLDLRKYGTIKHSGFGMGFERFLMFISGMKNIRDVIPLPRFYGSCKF